MMCSFEGASVARLLQTYLKVLCELAEGDRVGELVPQSQPPEESPGASDSPAGPGEPSEEICEVFGPAVPF